MKDIFEDKVVLVTGAGTIGSEIIEQLLDKNIKHVRVFDNSEHKLHILRQKYRNNKKVKSCRGYYNRWLRCKKMRNNQIGAYST